MNDWHDKLIEYRTAVETARMVLNDLDTSSAAPGEKEQGTLRCITILCNLAIDRIDQCNEAYKKAQVLIND